MLQRGKDKSTKVCYNPEDLYLPEIVTLCPCGWLYKWCKIITFCSTEHNIHLGPRQQQRQSVQGSCSCIRMHSDLGTWSPALSSQKCDAKLESLNAPSLLLGPGRLDWSAAPAAFRSWLGEGRRDNGEFWRLALSGPLSGFSIFTYKWHSCFLLLTNNFEFHLCCHIWPKFRVFDK